MGNSVPRDRRAGERHSHPDQIGQPSKFRNDTAHEADNAGHPCALGKKSCVQWGRKQRGARRTQDSTILRMPVPAVEDTGRKADVTKCACCTRSSARCEGGEERAVPIPVVRRGARGARAQQTENARAGSRQRTHDTQRLRQEGPAAERVPVLRMRVNSRKSTRRLSRLDGGRGRADPPMQYPNPQRNNTAASRTRKEGHLQPRLDRAIGERRERGEGVRMTLSADHTMLGRAWLVRSMTRSAGKGGRERHEGNCSLANGGGLGAWA
ncbi:hypothetical protein C8R44DRAFT_738167 [Mycena epipterygia]|nr:hypothetical protein C8R44DRAFT_738167 [Mycena epipterygia]